MKIKSELPPTRCEICHQSDCFNPDTGVCSRCETGARAELLKVARPDTALYRVTAPLRAFRTADLWEWSGDISRTRYLVLGILLMLLKLPVDALIAATANQPWHIYEYLSPTLTLLTDNPSDVNRDRMTYYIIRMALSLPFIWAGLVLTRRRLRSVGLPSWLVLGFFLPAANWIFFLVLSVLPNRPVDHEAEMPPPGRFGKFLGTLIPRSVWGSALMAAFLVVPPGIAIVAFSTNVLQQYGASLFFVLPFCLGLGAALLHGFHQERNWASCLLAAELSLILVGFALLFLAFEGAICLIMASPIAMFLAGIGSTVGYFIQRRPALEASPIKVLLAMFLALPALMGAEAPATKLTTLRPVVTTVDIAAPPEVVWKNVVSFSEIPPTEDWVFKTGIAYPLRATIKGTGPGAVRYCTFSTGSFVEPIDVWDEPRLLKFSVAEQPDTMHEWSPYNHLHPPHLDDFMRSQRGQFRLIPLSGNRTRLEGTTWYEERIHPIAYWQIWSDAIIHRIHGRVLNHIKNLSETKTETRQP